MIRFGLCNRVSWMQKKENAKAPRPLASDAPAQQTVTELHLLSPSDSPGVVGTHRAQERSSSIASPMLPGRCARKRTAPMAIYTADNLCLQVSRQLAPLGVQLFQS